MPLGILLMVTVTFPTVSVPAPVPATVISGSAVNAVGFSNVLPCDSSTV